MAPIVLKLHSESLYAWPPSSALPSTVLSFQPLQIIPPSIEWSMFFLTQSSKVLSKSSLQWHNCVCHSDTPLRPTCLSQSFYRWDETPWPKVSCGRKCQADIKLSSTFTDIVCTSALSFSHIGKDRHTLSMFRYCWCLAHHYAWNCLSRRRDIRPQ